MSQIPLSFSISIQILLTEISNWTAVVRKYKRHIMGDLNILSVGVEHGTYGGACRYEKGTIWGILCVIQHRGLCYRCPGPSGLCIPVPSSLIIQLYAFCTVILGSHWRIHSVRTYACSCPFHFWWKDHSKNAAQKTKESDSRKWLGSQDPFSFLTCAQIAGNIWLELWKWTACWSCIRKDTRNTFTPVCKLSPGWKYWRPNVQNKFSTAIGSMCTGLST